MPRQSALDQGGRAGQMRSLPSVLDHLSQRPAFPLADSLANRQERHAAPRCIRLHCSRQPDHLWAISALSNAAQRHVCRCGLPEA